MSSYARNRNAKKGGGGALPRRSVLPPQLPRKRRRDEGDDEDGGERAPKRLPGTFLTDARGLAYVVTFGLMQYFGWTSLGFSIRKAARSVGFRLACLSALPPGPFRLVQFV